MKLHEYIDLIKLQEYITEGLITDRKHPVHDLRILNYSHAAQSLAGSKWDVTLSRCRGLVYETTSGYIYAIPFPKFWNYSYPAHPETLPENLPTGLPNIYEKVDGSLGIGFYYKGEFIVATRGSFESDQAKWANQYVKKNQVRIHLYDKNTYLFEIVYREDKKVVDYNYEGLVLLGAIDANGEEWPPDSVVARSIAKCMYLRKARREEINIEHLPQDKENEEGYVAVWYGPPTFRVKIKFETYKRLHRMYFQTTTDVIWELVKDGKALEGYLTGADDSLKSWVFKTEVEIKLKVIEIQFESKKDFREIIDFANTFEDKERRKAFALKATKKPNSHLLFLLYDAKLEEYKEAVWKLARPVNERFLYETTEV